MIVDLGRNENFSESDIVKMPRNPSDPMMGGRGGVLVPINSEQTSFIPMKMPMMLPLPKPLKSPPFDVNDSLSQSKYIPVCVIYFFHICIHF